MNSMFSLAESFGADLSEWNLAKVQDASFMFDGATSFDSDVSKWNTSSLIYAAGMFSGATSFQGRGISKWETESLVDASAMFFFASQFNQRLCWDLNREVIGGSNGRFVIVHTYNMFCGSGGQFEIGCAPKKLIKRASKNCPDRTALPTASPTSGGPTFEPSAEVTFGQDISEEPTPLADETAKLQR